MFNYDYATSLMYILPAVATNVYLKNYTLNQLYSLSYIYNHLFKNQSKVLQPTILSLFHIISLDYNQIFLCHPIFAWE